MKNTAQILEQLLQERKSIAPAQYAKTPIPQEVLEKILASTQYTPNHKNTRPWRFKLFQHEEKAKLGETLAEIYKNTIAPERFMERKYHKIKNKATDSDAIISICVNFSGKIPEWEELAATAMAVQNMYLTCTAYQVGCYWSSPKLIHHLGDFLQLEENEKCYGLFYMGMKKND